MLRFVLNFELLPLLLPQMVCGLKMRNLQIYDDTEEGQKVCTFYKLSNIPTTLLLDPLTGQKMRGWAGMISAERLLEVLSSFALEKAW